LAYRQSSENSQEILKVEEHGALTSIYRCSLEDTCDISRFHTNGQQIYLKTNRMAKPFLMQVIKRYQAELSPALEAQLETLTVDVDTLT